MVSSASWSVQQRILPYPFRSVQLETVWVKCPYWPHPSQFVEDLGLFDVVLVVVPLDDDCPSIGNVALAVLPGGLERVHAVLGSPLHPPFSRENIAWWDTSCRRRITDLATHIYGSFCKWWVINELWYMDYGLNAEVRAWFLKNMVEAQKSSRRYFHTSST
ncbi:uncharacterized protein BO80DRAFT_423275, partial [Aspergillus ibericus CBS 121593]